MINPFNIKDAVGPDYNHDLDDVYRTKTALKDLGHFETPRYGLTQYPDTPLFEGIRSYQRARGLRADGIIKPGGPTATAMGRDLAARAGRGRTPGFAPRPAKDTDRQRGAMVPKPKPASATTFDTVGEVGWGRKNDPVDVLAARRALAWAGHLPKTAAGDRKSSGNDLFAAIEDFQRRAGVKKDGFMRPGGETAEALNDVIAPKVQAYLENVAGAMDTDKRENADVQVAMAPKPRYPGERGPEGATILNPWIGGGGIAIFGAGANEVLRQRGERVMGGGEVAFPPAIDGSRPSSSGAVPAPPSPPPLDIDGFRQPDRDEEPDPAAATPKIPALENSKIINDIRNGFPNGIEELKQILIVESRGDERTQRPNNHCLDKMLVEARSRENVVSAKHVSGAESGEEGWKPEKLRRNKKGVRGVRADAQITVKLKDGTERLEEFQSIDTYADGETPDLREADAMDRMRQHKDFMDELGDILATPKRRDLTEEEAMAICDQKVEEFADKHWGPPKAKQDG